MCLLECHKSFVLANELFVYMYSTAVWIEFDAFNDIGINQCR